MVLPDVVKSHPVISVVLVSAVIAALGLLAVNFSQGTFVDDQGCQWVPMKHPETGEVFTSETGLQNYFQDHGEQVPDSLQLQVRDGVLHKKLTCVNGGGSQ